MLPLVNEPYLTLKPYIPGKPVSETERELGITGVVKLASNENPYGPSPKAVAAVREALNQMDRDVPLAQVARLDASLDKAVAEPRMRATLLALFATLALALAAIGVYGVVAYLVGQRTQEIGVRRALGAQARDVVLMLVRESMRPVVLGMVIGVGGAFALSRVVSTMLFGVVATDAATHLRFRVVK